MRSIKPGMNDGCEMNSEPLSLMNGRIFSMRSMKPGMKDEFGMNSETLSLLKKKNIFDALD